MNKRIVFGRWRGTGSFQCGNLTKCVDDWAHCGDKCRGYAIVDAEELELFEKQLEAAETRVKELEAQCAVMREVLTEALELIDIDNNCPCWECERDRQIAQRIKESLSSSAGRAMLERLRKFEAVVEAAKTLIENTGVWPIEMLGRVDKLQIALMALKDGGQA